MKTGFFLATKLLFRLSLILQSQQYSTSFSLLVFQGTVFIHCPTWAFMPSGVWLSSDNCKNKKIKGRTDKFVFPPQPYYFSNMPQTAQTSALVWCGLFPFAPVNTKLWVCEKMTSRNCYSPCVCQSIIHFCNFIHTYLQMFLIKSFFQNETWMHFLIFEYFHFVVLVVVVFPLLFHLFSSTLSLFWKYNEQRPECLFWILAAFKPCKFFVGIEILTQTPLVASITNPNQLPCAAILKYFWHALEVHSHLLTDIRKS